MSRARRLLDECPSGVVVMGVHMHGPTGEQARRLVSALDKLARAGACRRVAPADALSPLWPEFAR